MGINATGFSLEPYSTTMVQNQTRQIKVAWQPWNAQANGVMWSTSNENIAVVDANGFVTAVSEGDSVITATGQVWDPYHWDNETGTTVPHLGGLQFGVQDQSRESGGCPLRICC